MLKLLSFLWSGCWHDWVYRGTKNVYSLDENGKQVGQYPTAFEDSYKCSKCNRIKVIKR